MSNKNMLFLNSLYPKGFKMNDVKNSKKTITNSQPSPVSFFFTICLLSRYHVIMEKT